MSDEEINEIVIRLAEDLGDSVYACERMMHKVPSDRRGDIFLAIGWNAYKLGYFTLAIRLTCYALTLHVRYSNRQGELRSYGQLGIVYDALDDYTKAIEFYHKSLEIAKEIGDRKGELLCYGNIGNTYHSLGEYTKAIKFRNKSLIIAKDIGDRQGESACYGNLGTTYYSLGEYTKAIEFHNKSLIIAKDIGDRQGESNCYSNLGVAHGALGEYTKAIEFHNKSLEIKKQIGDRMGEGNCYGNLGNTYYSLGEYTKAIEFCYKSLELAKEIGVKNGEAGCYETLGVVHNSLGEYTKAIEFYNKSLELAKEIGDKNRESNCYTNLGVSYYYLADYTKAIEFHNKSLIIAKDIGDRQGESACYGNLGNAFYTLGAYSEAIEFNNKSLEIKKQIGDRKGELLCYGNIGLSYHSLGEYTKAIEFHNKSLKIAKEIGDVSSESYVNFELADSHFNNSEQRDLAMAYRCCKRSIELAESLGSEIVEQEQKIGFYGLKYRSYELMVQICLELKKEKEAFEYVERSKSKAFLDILSAGTFRSSVKITKELELILQDEETHLAKLREIQIQSSKGMNIEIGRADRIKQELEVIYDKLEKIDPEYVSIRRPKSLSKDDTIDRTIQQILAAIKRDKGKDAVIVEYFVSIDKIYIFIVTPDSIEIVPVDCKESDLLVLVDRFLFDIKSHDDIDYLKGLSHQLSTYLIKPVSSYISKADLIYLVPYGILHYLPLHVLETDNNLPLIVDHAVAYLPSSSLLRFLKNKGKSTNSVETCSSFGVHFKEEAQVIAKLFDTNSYPDVTRDEVVDIISKIPTDVLHFSCHGKFDNIDPLSSGLLLYNDEKLTARDILNLNLKPELVTLSACETGINENKPGDELIGLTRSFIYAGTPSVLVSLWTVDTTSTLDLMVDFYKQLKDRNNETDRDTTNNTKKRLDRTDIATALQSAQKNIMQKKDYSHPYYWAPFVLVGDWE